MIAPTFLRPDRCALIGMVHLPALPGAPGYAGNLRHVEDHARRDADALQSGGADAVLVENFHDTPFFPGRVPAETVAAMAAIVRRLRDSCDLPLGVNVLRNDGLSAMAIATAAGADFVRVNVLTGARMTDQGIVSGEAHEILRNRARLAAGHVAILADVAVKHSAPLAPYPLDQEVADLVHRGGADVLVVSGSGTGTAVELEELRAVRTAAPGSPVLVGSGVTASNAATLAEHCDGAIVGTSLKPGGIQGPIDPARVRAVADALARG